MPSHFSSGLEHLNRLGNRPRGYDHVPEMPLPLSSVLAPDLVLASDLLGRPVG
jgi:hypothetical protein